MGPAIALFLLTLRQTLLSKKVWLALLLLSGPSVLMLIVRNFGPPIDKARELWEMYNVMAQLLLILGLIPLICIVYGTALIGADVENRTIVYLITRRMHRATVLAVRYLATGVVLAVLCDAAMIGIHLCVLAGRDLPALTAGTDYASWDPMHDLACYLAALPLAVFAFLAVFSLIGVLSSRPLTASVIYYVAIEFVLGNIPIEARVYTVTHQVRATLAGWMPRVTELYPMPDALRDTLFKAGSTAIPQLLVVILAALGFACALATVRELVPAKVAREA